MQAIFDKSREIIEKLKSMDIDNLTTIEIIAMLFYGGRFITEYQNQSDWMLFYEFIEKIDKYVFTHYDLVERDLYLSEKNKFLTTSKKPKFSSYLFHMEGIIKDKYREKIQTLRSNFDILNKANSENILIKIMMNTIKYEIDDTLNIYLNVNLKKILSYIIYQDNNIMNSVFDTICLHYSEYINMDEIQYTMENLRIQKKEHLYLKEIQKKIIEKINQKMETDSENKEKYENLKKQINIENMIKDYVKHNFESPYSIKLQVQEYFAEIEKEMEDFSIKLEEKMVGRDFEILAMKIQMIENKIIDEADKRTLEGEDLDTIFPEIIQREIVFNKFNVTPFAEQTMFDLFMTKKSMVKLGVSLVNCAKNLQETFEKYCSTTN